MNQPAQQGHVYSFKGCRVLALGTGQKAQAMLLDTPDLWPPRLTVNADELQPLPMRYFHGQTPKEV